jgi:hypothetical protein
MGASGWDYCVPYQADLNVALKELQTNVLASGDYLWPYEDFDDDDEEPRPRPTTLEQLFGLRDEEVMETEGTHSILDMDRVIAVGESPDDRDIFPLTDQEAESEIGTKVLTRAHVEALNDLTPASWIGCCAVLHDDQGQPAELFFWGCSGD